MDENSINVMRDRYGYIRDEIMYRLEVRYKILQYFMAVVVFGLTAIYRLDWQFVALPCMAAMMALVLLMYGENKQITRLSDYLIEIERKLDKLKDVHRGWERESRAAKSGKRDDTRAMLLGAMLFVICFFVIFAFQSAVFLTQSYPPIDQYLNGYGTIVLCVGFLLMLIIEFWLLMRDGKTIWKKTAR